MTDFNYLIINFLSLSIIFLIIFYILLSFYIWVRITPLPHIYILCIIDKKNKKKKEEKHDNWVKRKEEVDRGDARKQRVEVHLEKKVISYDE